MDRNNATIIVLDDIKTARYVCHFDLDKGFFDRFENDELIDGNVAVGIEAERVGQTIVARLTLGGKVMVPCDRCLDPVGVEISGNETLTIRFADNAENDDANENEIVLSPNAKSVDLSQRLYEYVAVRIPLRHVHLEGQCNAGMQQLLQNHSSQTNSDPSDTDPRWDALNDLM